MKNHKMLFVVDLNSVQWRFVTSSGLHAIIDIPIFTEGAALVGWRAGIAYRPDRQGD